jgi:hypothetical protein
MEGLLSLAVVGTATVTCAGFGALVAWLSLEGVFRLINKSKVWHEPAKRG